MSMPISSLAALRDLFQREVSIKHIAEPIASFDSSKPAPEARAFMARLNYDVIGVRNDGTLAGYAEMEQLGSGTLSEYLVPFAEEHLLEDTASILDAFKKLELQTQVFVRALGQVSRIVTKGDLRKAPIRIWIFGLVNLIEMHMLRLVRKQFPDGGWEDILLKDRIQDAEKLLEDRKLRNEHIDLADCLQFADKRDILLKNRDLLLALGFTSKGEAEKLLKKLEQIRNELTHAQDVMASFWPELVSLCEKGETFLMNAERL